MLGIELSSAEYLARLTEELARVDRAALERWSDHLFTAWENGRQVFILGNGGSGSTASHMSEDLAKSTVPDPLLKDDRYRRLRVQSLTDNTAWILAIANDIGFEDIFVQQLRNLGQRGDLVVAISGSGNSPNVLRAVEWARAEGLTTFSLTGYQGGKLRTLAEDGLHIDLADMGMVESIHLCLFHWVLNDLHARMNRVGRHAARAAAEEN